MQEGKPSPPEHAPADAAAPAQPLLKPVAPAAESFLALVAKAADSPFMRTIRRMQESSLQLGMLDSPFLRLAKQMQEDPNRWQKVIGAIEPSPLIKAIDDIARRSEAWRLAATTAAHAADSPWMQLQKTLMQSSRFFEGVSRSATAYESPLLKQFEDIARRSNISAEFAKTGGDLLATLRAVGEAARPQLEAIAGAGTLTAAEAELAGIGTVTAAPTIGTTAPSEEITEGAEVKWNRWFERQPFVVKIFLHLLLFIMLPEIFTHRVEHAFLAEKEPMAQHAVVNEIQNDFGKEFADGLRCVRGKGLRVREEPDTNGRVVGNLTEHQGIEVLETHGAWSKIRYFDSASGAVTEGWAASGYLAKFKC
jgi:Bacterial SH3 domain